MQKINRLPLSAKAARQLAELTLRVTSADNPKAEAQRLWIGLARGIRGEIQKILAQMSTGLERCMYCEDSQGTDIEHFRPKSTHPDQTFIWANYLLACARCNSNYKRTRFPLDIEGNPLLIDPTIDDPVDHLLLTPTTGIYIALDDKGTTTIEICGLNRDVCARGRVHTWTTMECLIPLYSTALSKGRLKQAEKIMDVLREHPFQSVRSRMSRIFQESADPALLLSEDVINAFKEHPDLL
ncbi:hypothetical protein [Acrocarpospora catenulata]|uniref:hypothetical protein n=1 Tax=Acrocarpospora catenulata TaxID=2836182 RepID=UPI001BD9F6C6|nr:hypothetical protein [Acrocarpospora catenulata]